MVTIDIAIPLRDGDTIKTSGTAYYRLPQELAAFLALCAKEHKIIGFEYDVNEPANLGVILQDADIPTLSAAAAQASH